MMLHFHERKNLPYYIKYAYAEFVLTRTQTIFVLLIVSCKPLETNLDIVRSIDWEIVHFKLQLKIH